MPNEQVILLNADTSVLAIISWKKAMTLLVQDDAVYVDFDDDRRVRSQSLDLPWPRKIMLNKYIFIPYDHRKFEVSPIASRRGVLERDNFKCAYCGKAGDTWDHVVPKAQGGSDEWINTVCACFPCNNKKSDRTPKEAGMKLLFEPYIPTFDYRQKRIMRTISKDFR